MSDFTGCKVALFSGDRLIMCLRDDKPGLPYPNMWDFPGGGRENEETAFECISREVDEELSVKLNPTQIVWQREYPSKLKPGYKSYFFVARVTQDQVGEITFGDEGQGWKLMSVHEYLSRNDVVPHHKSRLRDYLERQ